MSYRGPAHPGMWNEGESGPTMEAICPQSDSPIRPWHRFGFQFLRRSLVPRKELHNPLYWYLVPKIRSGAGPAVVFGSWAILTVLETIAIYSIFQLGSNRLLATAGLVELAILPALAAAWMAKITGGRLRKTLQKVSFDELATTQIAPKQLLQSFAAPPYMMQSTALLLSSVLLAAMLAAYQFVDHKINGADLFDARIVLMGFFLVIRHDAITCFSDLGWGAGLYDSLRSKVADRGMLRTLRRISIYAIIDIFPPAAVIAAVEYFRGGGVVPLSIISVIAAMIYPFIGAFASDKGTLLYKAIREQPNWWWYFERSD